ncbi:MAG: cobalamin-dependent protein, partial [Candidatus Hodarchaeota archaeon]
MRVLFIYPNINTIYSNWNYGIACLSAVLKRGGHETSLLNLTRLNELPIKIKNFKFDMIAISSSSNQWPYSKQIAKYLKRKYGKMILVGGPHVTVYPDA